MGAGGESMMSSNTGSFMEMGVKGGISLSPSYFTSTSNMEDEGPGDDDIPGEAWTPRSTGEATDKLKLLAGLLLILHMLLPHSPDTELPDRFGRRFLAKRDWIRSSRILSSY